MIVLLTDFGQSEYVGVMKGVIYSIACDAKIVTNTFLKAQRFAAGKLQVKVGEKIKIS